MPAYHSSYNEELEHRVVGNMAFLPFATKIRGPALPPDADRSDIIAEALELFRANALFRNFEILGAADRVLIYLILFIGDCLSRIGTAKAPGWSQQEAVKQLTTHALENFTLPGEAGFPLNSVYAPPSSRNEGDALRQYLLQARQETVLRLVERVYDASSGGKPSKWWMCFQKRRFMGKSLSS